jgi:hypothetical protein
VVAFVNGNYTFADAEVGYCGRNSDTTVTKESAFYRAVLANPTAMLGEDGFMITDGGITAEHLLSPYMVPTTPEEQWFNFCHSSTRFVVEQVRPSLPALAPPTVCREGGGRSHAV